MLFEVLAALTAPAVVDSLVGAFLARSARGTVGLAPLPASFRWLVVVPARDEGARVVETVGSVSSAAESAPSGISVRTLVVLDGPDRAAEEAMAGAGVSIAIKRPSGPSKGAVLAWICSERGQDLEKADGVLLLDVGSALSPGFFSRFSIPPGKAAVQALLRGTGPGVGAGASASERFAQDVEDRGREGLGWGVRLRGTGTAMTTEAFRAISPLLRTRVEDLEASLLLGSLGAGIVLGAEGAEVLDEKPPDASRAASQRARWFIGRWSLLFRQLPALLRLISRRPLEGAAFACEIASRPFSFWLPARLLCGVVLGLLAFRLGSPRHGAAAVVEVASSAASIGLLASNGLLSREGAALFLSWLRAILFLPAALLRWLRARP